MLCNIMYYVTKYKRVFLKVQCGTSYTLDVDPSWIGYLSK